MVIHVFFLIHVRYDYSKTGNVCYNIYSELKKVRGVIVKKRSRIIAFLLLSVLIFTLIGSTGKNITKNVRSEEHTSELQSRFDLVCRLLLEKKNKHSTQSSLH